MEMFPATSGALARVVPRACCGGGDVFKLEMQVEEALRGPGKSTVVVLGEPGSGKTTALRHLMATFRSRSDIRWFDEPTGAEVGPARKTSTVVMTGTVSPDLPDCTGLPVFRLAPWGRDEWIEYVLNGAKDRCASVMHRLLHNQGRGDLDGLPEICAAALDEFIADEQVTDVGEALRRAVTRLLGGHRLDEVADRILDRVRAVEIPDPGKGLRAAARQLLRRMVTGSEPAGALLLNGLFRHQSVRDRLAAHRLVERIAGGDTRIMEGRVVPRLVRAAARSASTNSLAQACILGAIDDDGHRIGRVGVSLLCCAGVPWSPTPGRRIRLSGALLQGVRWEGVSLRGVDASQADFSHAVLVKAWLNDADLSGANFRGAVLAECSLEGANLSGAHLACIDGRSAALARANLRSANLEGAAFDGAVADECEFVHCRAAGASFVRASLREARMRRCDIEGADFAGADFTGATLISLTFHVARIDAARFTSAVIRESSFAGVNLPAAEFGKSVLENVDFTGSVMPNANFAGARLTGCGLADVWWEKADLSGADFRGCTFHMGTSRSGLVFSPVACEGSRTGFYTDEYAEQDFKAPEEISKADLRGADLRGANIEGVDFYLVDLRGAKYDASQETWFKRCGAILHGR